ncbi:MAG: acyl-CoA thioesterase [Desulfobacterales bacterium]|nr:acyl-CoA thioesterase [Desulfobacterales bacterium]
MVDMSENNPRISEVRLKVPFHDLDPMRVVWHGNYLKYFDIARFALFREAGVDLHEYALKTNCFLPVVRTSTKHIAPLRHNDEFICKATLVEAYIRIVLDFEIRLVDGGKVCTRGQGCQVAVQYPEKELLLGLPDDICKALGVE